MIEAMKSTMPGAGAANRLPPPPCQGTIWRIPAAGRIGSVQDKLICRAFGRMSQFEWRALASHASQKERANGWIGQVARSENTSQSLRPLIWINARAVQSAMVALSERKPT